MDEEQDAIYQSGYQAYLSGESELSNPYVGLDAEFWSDGWEDAQEDTDIKSKNNSNERS